MITFMDRSFCSAYGKTCATDNCYRAMNPAMSERYKKWASGFKYASVSYMDMSDGCDAKTAIIEAAE